MRAPAQDRVARALEHGDEGVPGAGLGGEGGLGREEVGKRAAQRAQEVGREPAPGDQRDEPDEDRNQHPEAEPRPLEEELQPPREERERREGPHSAPLNSTAGVAASTTSSHSRCSCGYSFGSAKTAWVSQSAENESSPLFASEEPFQST